MQAEPAIFSAMFILFFLIGGILGTLLTIIPFWKICSKAGFPGALSLLMLVPIANIVLPFYIAFADWPALQNSKVDTGTDDCRDFTT